MRVAHLSGLHVFSLEGAAPGRFLSKRGLGAAAMVLGKKAAYPYALAEAAVADLRRQGVDHVLVTGDLTNLSLEAEFAKAKELLESTGFGPQALSVIPGNHDVYTHGAERASRFERFLGAYATSDPELGLPPGYPYVRLRGPLAIVGLSTAVATPWFFASGRAGSLQLAALERVLARPELADRFVTVLLHHPPVPGVIRSPLRWLDDAAAFRAALCRTPPSLVLYGHEHRSHWGTLELGERVVPYRCAGSTTHLTSRRGYMGRYNIYEVEGDRLAGTFTRIYDREGALFRAAEAGDA